MESDQNLAQPLVDLVRVRDQVDALSQALLPSRTRVFGHVSLPLPDVDGPAELAFIRTSSWLYVHYFEVGRVSVRFLVRRDGTRSEGSHVQIVRALRTWAEHNLDPRSKSDVAIAETCQRWFEANCGTRLPRTEDHWRALCAALITAARSFLSHLLSVLGDLEKDPDRDLVLQQWEARLIRDWPAHRYHELIAEVASDLGRIAVDPVEFFKRHNTSFSASMRILRDDCDMELEVRKLVERAFLADTAPVLPITGHDIMATLEVSPGPEVGRLLERAKSLYLANPCDGSELLKRVADEHRSPPG